MKRYGVVLSAGLSLFAVGSAHAYTAPNGFQVRNLPNGNFQVMNRGGISASNAWCAAGDFAMGVLGVAPGTPVYRVSQPPPPRGANIEFSLSSAGAATSTGMNTIGGGGGASMPAVAGRNMCNLLSAPGGRR